MSITRRSLSAFVIMASLIGANLVMSQPAQAATTAISCSGTVTARYYASYPGVGVVGELIVYYNSANGGTNSACMYHRAQLTAWPAIPPSISPNAQRLRARERVPRGLATIRTVATSAPTPARLA